MLEAPSALNRQDTRGEPKILVVDDHRNACHALAVGLRGHGCEALQAGGADEAWRLLEAHRVDWVICDVRMPRTNGLELVRTLRVHRPEVRIVLMTAYHLTDAEQHLAKSLDVPVVMKPVTAEGLLLLMRDGAPRDGAAVHQPRR